MWTSRAITTPFGLSVFGSAQKRVEPDHVSIVFAVSRLEETPSMAFESAKLAAAEVQAFIAKNNIPEFGSSQLHLEQTTEWANQKQQFVGYTASMKFSLVVRELSQFESILTGIVDAGANQIVSVTFGTDRLKTIRQEMRELAVKEAMAKAQTYCNAANVKLGKVIHIEDVNPDETTRYVGGHGQPPQEVEEDSSNAFNPASITVKGAVMLGFELE